MLLFGQVRSRRVNFESQWEEAAALCWPEYRNSFSFGHSRSPGAKYTEFQVDASGSIASHRFMAICDALLTPHSMLWSTYKLSNKELMKDRSVQLYCQQVTETIWRHRYRPEANFMSQNQQNWQALGVFGNMGMIVDELDTRPGKVERGVRYISTSPGEMYWLTNHQGRVDGFIRQFRWTARQAAQRWPETLPPVLKTALDSGSQELYDFLQFVMPRTDYDPWKVLSNQGKPWSSCYVSVVGQCVLEEGGYRSFPVGVGRYMQAPEEDYGRGPGQMVLPELKTLNAEKAAFLKQAHRAGDPTYLLADDGLMDFKSIPGAYNFGAMSADGKRLVDVLPTGNIQVTEEALQQSKRFVDDAFLVSLFPLLFDDKGRARSAREVIEMANEKGIFLAPTLGRQFGEYLGNINDRELDVLSYQRLLPAMPPIMREARGEYQNQTVFCGPLARAMKGQAIAGYMRTIEMAQAAIQAGADPEIMDVFDLDVSIPEIAEEQFSPANWMASPAKLAQKRKGRADAAERDRQVKELPGKAAIMKAQAISDKAATGGNTGGTLSGTPAGGMPMMPGQSEPGGAAFGQPGPQPGMPNAG